MGCLVRVVRARLVGEGARDREGAERLWKFVECFGSLVRAGGGGGGAEAAQEGLRQEAAQWRPVGTLPGGAPGAGVVAADQRFVGSPAVSAAPTPGMGYTLGICWLRAISPVWLPNWVHLK